MLEQLINQFWYHKSVWKKILWPLTLPYMLIVSCRKKILQSFYQKETNPPVIIVGNITAGGTGKTPLIVAIARELARHQYKVGIISRGYKSRCKKYPYQVLSSDNPEIVGDEPLLLSKNTGCPVVIAPNRLEAYKSLIKNNDIQIVLSDDGLQHYQLPRALEIVLIDGQRLFGNELCIPFGPLREPIRRIHNCNIKVVNGGHYPHAFQMNIKARALISVNKHKTELAMKALTSQTVAAVAGIGNPQRFFKLLTQLGYQFKPYIFNDHHIYREADLKLPEKIIIMTEKDALKCHHFNLENLFYLPIEAVLEKSFWEEFWSYEFFKKLP